MNQMNALKILNRERDYEDKIAKDLYSYYLYSLEGIKGISIKEKSRIKEYLNHIMKESQEHEIIFGKLVAFVLENGENNY